MASNGEALLDGDGDSSDWIEIHNTSNDSVPLTDWYLTDTQADLVKWAFPATNMPPQSYLVVFASDKVPPPAGELHANFKLGAGGEYLGLVYLDPTGAVAQVVDQYAPSFPAQSSDISYGRISSTNASQFGYMAIPTPGSANAVSGPYLFAPWSSPSYPMTNTNIRVGSQFVLNGAPLLTRELLYRVNFGPEIVVPLDTQSNAFGEISTNAFAAGDMVRWRFRAADVNGTVYLPALNTQTGQSQTPEYFGAVIEDPSIESNLPVLHWFVEDTAAANTDAGTRASAWFNGQFYDNFFVRIRGASTRGLQKKSYKFDFNPGDHFRFDPDERRVEEFNLNTTYTDKAYIRQGLGYEMYNQWGSPAPTSALWRVERNGSFFSVTAWTEQPDEDFLKRNDLDENGALYKMYNAGTATGNAQKRTRESEDKSDLEAFIDIRNRSGQALQDFIFDHVDVPRVMNYLSVTALIQHGDSMSKNYFLYRDTEGTGEWSFIPWDEDLSFGRHYMTKDNIRDDELMATWDYELAGRNNDAPISPSHPFVGMQALPGNRSWNRIIDALFRDPVFTDMYRRRFRSLMDEVLQPASTPLPNRYLENRIDALVQHIGNDATLDRAAWTEWGIPMSITQAVDALKVDFLAPRRTHLFETHLASNAASYPEPNAFSAMLPDAQVAVPSIQFGALDFNPASGLQDEEWIDLINTNAFAVDISGWTIDDAIEHTFKPGVVIPANGQLRLCRDVAAYRAGPGVTGDYVTGTYDGGLNNFGEVLNLRTKEDVLVSSYTYAGEPTEVQAHLRITELHPEPFRRQESLGEPSVSRSGFEFIEWMNIGTNVLDISGVVLTNAVEFVVPTNTLLAAGERVVVVGNQTAFESRYGTEIRILGTYTDLLGCSKEVETFDALTHRIQSLDLVELVSDFSCGTGLSIELVDPLSDGRVATNWMDSAYIGGTPGGEPIGPAVSDVVINEVLTHTDLPLVDALELHNPGALAINISGWMLSDDFSDPQKFTIPPGTILPAGGFVVFDETDFRPGSTNDSGGEFAFDSANGDAAMLVAVDGVGRAWRVADAVRFGPAVNGESFSRWPDAVGALVPGKARTLGTYNVGPRIGPLVVTEIMYDAEASLRYIELHNPYAEAIQYQLEVGDTGVVSAHLWGFTMETVVLVSFDPSADVVARNAFLAEYGVTNNLMGLAVVGNLNEASPINVRRPTVAFSESPNPFYTFLDYVPFQAAAPWPVVSSGEAIHRLSVNHVGDRPGSWGAAPPSPGVFTNTVAVGFAAWQSAAFDAGVPAADREAGADPNQNGMGNLLEYLLGRDPMVLGGALPLQIQYEPGGEPELMLDRRQGLEDVGLGFGLSEDLFSWRGTEGMLMPHGQREDLGEGMERLRFALDPSMTNKTLYFRLEAELFE